MTPQHSEEVIEFLTQIVVLNYDPFTIHDRAQELLDKLGVVIPDPFDAVVESTL